MTGAQKERSGREDNMEKQGHSLPRPVLGDLDQEPATIPELFEPCGNASQWGGLGTGASHVTEQVEPYDTPAPH